MTIIKKMIVLFIGITLLIFAVSLSSCSTIDERQEMGTDSCVE